MELSNLSEEQVKTIIRGLTGYDNELKTYLQKQYDEQMQGGPWRRRMREQGYVI